MHTCKSKRFANNCYSNYILTFIIIINPALRMLNKSCPTAYGVIESWTFFSKMPPKFPI